MTWTAAELGGFVTAAGAALVLVIKVCFSGMSESRCEAIRCGCCEIARRVRDAPAQADGADAAADADVEDPAPRL